MIDARDLTKAYGGFLAADGVTFGLARGELFVIMGLSGSGKSTVLRMLNRLVEPTAGTLRIDGDDVIAMKPDELRALRNRTISMVFQHFALFPHRTIRQNAAYGLQVRGVAAAERLERADWALERVGLAARGDAYPHQLSGGMKQRVGLARAFATDAPILLMDEPFSALDPLIRRDMQELLLMLQKTDQRTIVFVTHDLNEAMLLGDHIMLMKDGCAVQTGTGPQILSAPAGDYVRAFVTDVDRARVLTARNLMCPPPLVARVGEAPARALERLQAADAADAAAVYVLDHDDRVVGVAHTAELAAAARDGRADLTGCVVAEYPGVAADAPVADFCRLAGAHVVPVAVVDADRRLLGVVTPAAILAALGR